MSSIVIGTSDQERIVYDRSSRETHTHVIGVSGTGKSYFLESMIRSDIAKGAGVCFIDPHGETAKNILSWLATSGIRHNQVHYLCPGEGDFSVGFNPLALPEASTSRRVSDMVTACERVWGGNSTVETPRLRKCLRATLFALAHHRLSLLEADMFTSVRHRDRRDTLVSQLPPGGIADEWAEFAAYSDREFREYFESTRSRLFEFATSPAIQPIIGQTEDVLDFSVCMERGDIVIVNLAESGTFTKREGQLLGAMITADLYSTARQRDVAKAKRQPFYCYIDECADYLNEDIAKSLDETRKYGLHYILSHQRLNQLRSVSDDCYDAVMANAQTKIVFKVDDDDSAEILCRHMLRADFDLEKPKETLIRPVAVGQEIIELFSWGSFETDTETSSYGSQEGTGSGDSVSMFVPDEGEGAGQTEGTSQAVSSGTSSSESFGRSTTQSETRNQTLQTVYELMPTAVYSLDEIIHLGINLIRNMPMRHALLRMSNQRAIPITTLEVKNRRPLKAQLDRYVRKLHQRSYCTQNTSDVMVAINDRLNTSPNDLDLDDDQFSYPVKS